MQGLLMLFLTTVLIHWLYSMECCHDKDCRPVPCEQIVSVGDTWMWNGKQFTRAMLRESPDGECHICAAPQPLCIYLPPRV